jgi:hypothetical protein
LKSVLGTGKAGILTLAASLQFVLLWVCWTSVLRNICPGGPWTWIL